MSINTGTLDLRRNSRSTPERKIATSEGIFPAWTPDSKSLVVADRATAEDPFQLVMLGVNDGSRRELTTPALCFAAHDEMLCLAREFYGLVRKSGIPTPTIDGLRDACEAFKPGTGR